MSGTEDIIDKIKKIAACGARLPMKALPLWVEAIGAGAFIAAIVDANPGFRERLAEIDGKVFRFEASDIGKTFYLCIKDNDIKVVPHMNRAPDVTMKGSMGVLASVLLGRVDPDTVFFSRKLEISGDTAAAIHALDGCYRCCGGGEIGRFPHIKPSAGLRERLIPFDRR
jgi:predicted lipid carrier protein YhbT